MLMRGWTRGRSPQGQRIGIRKTSQAAGSDDGEGCLAPLPHTGMGIAIHILLPKDRLEDRRIILGVCAQIGEAHFLLRISW
jgi:hypothetical protein